VITWDDVLLVAPALSTLSVAQQNLFLSMAETTLNATELGDKYDMACTYFCAHMGTVTKNGANGPGGPISAESTGRVSRSYAVPATSDDFWSTTMYGRTYQMILNSLLARVGFVL